MKNINYDRFKLVIDEDERFRLALDELSKFDPDDPPPLSDVYLNLNEGGQIILIALEHLDRQNNRVGGRPFTWTIQVKRDEWGNVPQPGDVVERVIPINRKDRKHHPVSAREMNAAIVDGSFSERFERRIPYVVDNKGCIRCTYVDAGYFLFNWGVHYKTGFGICGKSEYSEEPVKTPGGQHLHVHYWRYAEAPKEFYDKLPERKIEPETQVKRGRPPKEDKN
jgi:hypothetical protein